MSKLLFDPKRIDLGSAAGLVTPEAVEISPQALVDPQVLAEHVSVLTLGMLREVAFFLESVQVANVNERLSKLVPNVSNLDTHLELLRGTGKLDSASADRLPSKLKDFLAVLKFVDALGEEGLDAGALCELKHAVLQFKLTLMDYCSNSTLLRSKLTQLPGADGDIERSKSAVRASAKQVPGLIDAVCAEFLRVSERYGVALAELRSKVGETSSQLELLWLLCVERSDVSSTRRPFGQASRFLINLDLLLEVPIDQLKAAERLRVRRETETMRPVFETLKV